MLLFSRGDKRHYEGGTTEVISFIDDEIVSPPLADRNDGRINVIAKEVPDFAGRHASLMPSAGATAEACS